MIREFHVADFFTLANAACGVAAVFLRDAIPRQPGTRSYFYVAAALAPAAFVFDVLDGRIARSRQEHSALGRELDSLADVISFGVAPAALGFAAGLSGRMGLGGAALLRVLRREPPRALQRDRGIACRRARARSPISKARPFPPACCSSPSSRWPRGRAASARRCSAARGRSGRGTCIRWSLLFVLSGTLMISKTLRIPKL